MEFCQLKKWEPCLLLQININYSPQQAEEFHQTWMQDAPFLDRETTHPLVMGQKWTQPGTRAINKWNQEIGEVN